MYMRSRRWLRETIEGTRAERFVVSPSASLSSIISLFLSSRLNPLLAHLPPAPPLSSPSSPFRSPSLSLSILLLYLLRGGGGSPREKKHTRNCKRERVCLYVSPSVGERKRRKQRSWSTLWRTRNEGGKEGGNGLAEERKRKKGEAENSLFAVPIASHRSALHSFVQCNFAFRCFRATGWPASCAPVCLPALSVGVRGEAERAPRVSVVVVAVVFLNVFLGFLS